jgi:hypothetical protein
MLKFMRTSLRSRLERLEAQHKRASQSVITIAFIRRLPHDFVGERHIVHVERPESSPTRDRWATPRQAAKPNSTR